MPFTGTIELREMTKALSILYELEGMARVNQLTSEPSLLKKSLGTPSSAFD